jgi:hypothetical protein
MIFAVMKIKFTVIFISLANYTVMKKAANFIGIDWSCDRCTINKFKS